MMLAATREETMRRTIILALAVILATASAGATDKADVVKTVRQFVDGFNQGDIQAALGTCASPAAIIDEFPPYSWQGATACADWVRDYDAGAKQQGMTGGRVTMGKPLFVEVTGDRGYAIFPVSFHYRQKGKPVTERGARLTVALQKQGTDWKITVWTWSKH
jgi:ketosteroid isomerase-like protein